MRLSTGSTLSFWLANSSGFWAAATYLLYHSFLSLTRRITKSCSSSNFTCTKVKENLWSIRIPEATNYAIVCCPASHEISNFKIKASWTTAWEGLYCAGAPQACLPLCALPGLVLQKRFLAFISSLSWANLLMYSSFSWCRCLRIALWLWYNAMYSPGAQEKHKEQVLTGLGHKPYHKHRAVLHEDPANPTLEWKFSLARQQQETWTAWYLGGSSSKS